MREKNIGSLLDYFLVSNNFFDEHVVESVIRKHFRHVRDELLLRNPTENPDGECDDSNAINPFCSNLTKTDFPKTVSRGGKKSNFKLTSMNVNGLRAFGDDKWGLDYLKIENPDIFVMMETKMYEKAKAKSNGSTFM